MHKMAEDKLDIQYSSSRASSPPVNVSSTATTFSIDSQGQMFARADSNGWVHCDWDKLPAKLNHNQARDLAKLLVRAADEAKNLRYPKKG